MTLRRRIRALLRPVSRGGLLVLTVGSVALFLVVALTATSLVAGHLVLAAAPDLPEPSVEVSQITDLNAAVRSSASRASTVLDRNGRVIGRFAPEETYVPLRPGEVPEVVEIALTAAEDQSFRDHHGFDPEGMVRAFVENAANGQIEQGGSTLTQQLAKNLFTGAEDSVERKLEELQIAIDLESRFTKDEILAAYVNSVFLGNGAVGFEAASQTYFDKPASELTLSEAALLVGMLPAPSRRDPRVDTEAAESARRHVLRRVAEVGTVPEAEVEAAIDAVPEILPPKPRVEAFPYYLDYVRRYLLLDKGVTPELLYEGGLTIETGLDPDLQYVARLAVADRLPAGGPEAAVAIVDNHTGLVRALVGGRNFDDAQVNLALGTLGGGTGRQAGSSFKPFVLATAIAQGYSPAQTIGAPETYLPRTVDDPKPVRNFSPRGYGSVSLVEATVRSINTAYVSLTEAVGAGNVRDLATSLGVRGLPEQVGPSIGIGAYETSPLDMATAYAAFATEGLRVESGPVRRLLGPDGDVVADFTPAVPAERRRVLSGDTARRVTAILEENVRRGTATRAQIGFPAAAKTGTSDEYANAWLVGYTPVLSAAVWVGHPEGNVPMRDVAGFSRVTGGSIPALIWHDVMAFAHAGRAVVSFNHPGPAPRPRVVLPGATTTVPRTTVHTRPTTTSPPPPPPPPPPPSTTTTSPPPPPPSTTTTTSPPPATSTTTTTSPPPSTTGTTQPPPTTTTQPPTTEP